MKTFKVICAAAVLALSLSIPAYGGDGHTVGMVCPTPASEPCPAPGIEAPATAPGDSGLIGTASARDGFPMLSDILWALASIF